MNTTNEKKASSLGKLLRLKCDLTSPAMCMDIEGKELVILTGINGSGKTMAMVLMWMMQTLGHITCLIYKEASSEEDIKQRVIESISILLKGCFSTPIEGTITAEMENMTITLSVEDEGRKSTISIKSELDSDNYDGAQPLFLSKNFRTFDQVLHYLHHRKKIKSEMLREKPELKDSKALDDMVGAYVMQENIFKIYDVLYLERIIMKRIIHCIDFDHHTDLKSLKELMYFVIDPDVPSITGFFSKDKNDDNEPVYQKPLVSLSAGEQSLITIYCAASLNN